MLIVFGGLPGTGKTTIARALAARRPATYLRIDTIEQALRDADGPAKDVGSAGYGVANALAEANLGGGRMVIVDAVHPVAQSRDVWRVIAARAMVRLVEVEVICSDPLEHRRRVERRTSDIPGLAPPDWDAVTTRVFEPWHGAHLILDTACLDPPDAVAAIERRIDDKA